MTYFGLKGHHHIDHEYKIMYSYRDILDHNSLQFIVMSMYNLKEQPSEWEFSHLHRSSNWSQQEIYHLFLQNILQIQQTKWTNNVKHLIVEKNTTLQNCG